ncbi:hypothetical protein [Streptomyces sp. bgisy027]
MLCPHGCGGAVQYVEQPASVLGLGLAARRGESGLYHIKAVL